MVKPNINLGVVLDLINNKVVINDNTDYSILGLDENDVAIALEFITPVDVLYINSNYNTPETAPDLFGTTRTFEYTPLPLLDNGCFIQGNYVLNAKLQYLPTDEVFTYTFQQNIDYSKKKLQIEHEIDCFCAGFSSIDRTNYNNSTEESYTQTINYPSETNESDMVYGGKIFNDDKLANGVYVTEVETIRYWSYGTNFQVYDESKGKATIQVDCSGMCEIKCSFNKLWDKYKDICGKNKEKSDELLVLLNKATALLTMINLNRKCGEVTKSDSLINQLKELLGNCDCGCGGCDDDEDIWVSGICGTGISGNAFDYVFQSCNNLISVNSSTNAGVVTYTICLNSSTINTMIENKFNVLIAPILSQLNWFQGLDTNCLVGFPSSGTDDEKKQYVIDTICYILSLLQKPPVAKNDFISTTQGQAVSLLVTTNDFFTSNVVATITTQGLNGTAVVGVDGKTITYTPTLPTFVGIDSYTYTITDEAGQTSSAVVTITINPTGVVGCNIVNPAVIVDAKLLNTTSVQFIIENATQYNGNVPTSEQYILNIYNSSNVILHSYNITGNTTSDPTFFTAPDNIANDWNYYKVQLLASSESTSGISCGSIIYETEAYTLTDLNSDIFAGTTAPCLGWLPTDTQTEKVQKLLDKTCLPITIYSTNGLSGDGQISSPVKLGGILTEYTTITTNNQTLKFASVNTGKLFLEKLRVTPNWGDENNAGFISYSSLATEIFSPPALGQTYTLGTDIRNNIFETKIINANNDIITHAYPNLFRWGAIVNTHMALNIDATIGGSIKDLVNLKLGGIYKNNILTGDTIQNYCSLYIEQCKSPYPEPNLINSYAIYQAGIDDVNRFFGEIRYSNGLTSVSDKRTKTEKEEFKLGLDILLKIRPIIFNRTEKYGDVSKDHVGIIAQELEEILPISVSEINDGGIKDLKVFNPETLTYLVINSVKELKKETDEKYNKLLEIIELQNKAIELLKEQIDNISK